MGLAEDELRAIEARWSHEEKLTHYLATVHASADEVMSWAQRDIHDLLTEVRRLQAVTASRESP